MTIAAHFAVISPPHFYTMLSSVKVTSLQTKWLTVTAFMGQGCAAIHIVPNPLIGYHFHSILERSKYEIPARKRLLLHSVLRSVAHSLLNQFHFCPSTSPPLEGRGWSKPYRLKRAATMVQKANILLH
jgi:hypothetical protein